jgi:hypothetical protein
MTNGSDYLLLVYAILPGKLRYIDFMYTKISTEQPAISESRVFILAETSVTAAGSSYRKIKRYRHAVGV